MNSRFLRERFLLCTFFLCSIVQLNAQQHKADSLSLLLLKCKQDTEKVNILVNISGILETINPDSAILFCKQALTLSRSISWHDGIIYSMYAVGTYYAIKGDVTRALAYEDSALKYSSSYNLSRRLGDIYNALGNIESDQNKYDSSLAYYFKAVAIDSLANQFDLGEVYNNIGINYGELGNYLKSEEYYLKSEKICEERNDKKGAVGVLANLANLYELQGDAYKALKTDFKVLLIDSSSNNQECLVIDYENIGERYTTLKDYTRALEYTYRSVDLGKRLGTLDNLLTGLSNLGIIFIQVYQNDTAIKKISYKVHGSSVSVLRSAILDSALKYELLCLKYANQVNNHSSLIPAETGMGLIFTLKKEYSKAIPHYQRAYNLADSLGLLREEMDNAQILARAFIKINNYQLAASYLDKAMVLKDSVFNVERNRQINELEAKYQSERKEKEIEALAQKNEIQNLQIKQNIYLIYGLVVLSLLIIAIAFLLIRQNRINTLHSKIELEHKLLRSQMNPHFIFNAMTGIQNYIYKEEPQLAANYLSSVFKLMRSIIEGSKEEYVLLEKEILTLRHYLTLQQLCFLDKFDFNITIDSRLDVENTVIPPMMAQPFIENALEHGIINKKDGKGIVDIRLTFLDHMFSLEIEDNGVGREKAKEIGLKQLGKHLSVATNITQERIKLLNKKANKKITMQIADLKDGNSQARGTRVTFCFPLNKIG
jgi:tetratricopeptide (TPR) repeat protein